MPETSSLTLEWVLRGGTIALVLLLGAMLLRDHGRLVSARLGALFAVGTAAYTICSAAGFHLYAGTWSIPLLALSAGNNVVFWGFASALFDDSFRLRWWHLGLWLLLVVLGVTECVIGGGSGLGIGLTSSSLAFAALAIGQTLSSWRGDLVEGRRQLRLFIVVASSLYIGLTAISQLLGASKAAPQHGSLVSALALLAIVGTIAWSLLRVGGGQSLFLAPPVLATAEPASEPSPAPADQGSVAALERLMSVERTYREEGLTIGALAQRLGLPEYRLRRLINQALGYRNFNSFLNFYRIREAKEALADPGQAAVPVLTIALDAGFSSLGPFNRAFKAETGMTPSEYRRIGQPIPESASPVSNPARRISPAP
ncbi:MAG: AraC family transcriptional regulator [Alphaproteobacteria bacterium]|nr:AraC family transcriptional regulator [Alphaproteobacteria bacterium]